MPLSVLLHGQSLHNRTQILCLGKMGQAKGRQEKKEGPIADLKSFIL